MQEGNKFKYLGMIISTDGGMGEVVTNRVLWREERYEVR